MWLVGSECSKQDPVTGNQSDEGRLVAIILS